MYNASFYKLSMTQALDILGTQAIHKTYDTLGKLAVKNLILMNNS